MALPWVLWTMRTFWVRISGFGKFLALAVRSRVRFTEPISPVGHIDVNNVVHRHRWRVRRARGNTRTRRRSSHQGQWSRVNVGRRVRELERTVIYCPISFGFFASHSLDSFCAWAICSTVISGQMRSLFLAAFLSPCAAATLNQAQAATASFGTPRPM